jgi:hypothetical protein
VELEGVKLEAEATGLDIIRSLTLLFYTRNLFILIGEIKLFSPPMEYDR